jgi:hypothetical protein
LESGFSQSYRFIIKNNHPGICAQFSFSPSVYFPRKSASLRRPLVAAFCIGFYLIPLTYPAMKSVQPQRRWSLLLLASILGTAAVPFRTYLVNIGVLNSLLSFAFRWPVAGLAAFASIAILITYNTIALGMLLWENRQNALRCPPLIFALLTVLFFVGEQLGVGGNIPFYDRYVLWTLKPPQHSLT